MKYLSILLLTLFVLTGCGKKTDPIPKSKLADLTPPAAVFYKVTDEGVQIDNRESDNLFIEKGIPEGDECTFFNALKVIGPKSTFVDKEVDVDQKYFYRVRKKSVQYGIMSEPYIFSLTYEKPLVITDAKFIKTPSGFNVSIETGSIFMRFDAYSGGKSIAQTGGNFIDIPASEIADNKLSLVLTDYYGNKGTPYALQVPEFKPVTPPSSVAAVSFLDFGAEPRIVWADTDNAEKYLVEVCEGVSCETFNSSNTSLIYTKPFKKCIDISVTAVNSDGSSQPTKVRYCKPEEE